jgi:hypothetical protein
VTCEHPFDPCFALHLVQYCTTFVASDNEPPDLHAPPLPLRTQSERRTFHFTLTFCSVRILILSLFYLPLRPCSLFLLFRNSCFYHLRKCHFSGKAAFSLFFSLCMHFLAVSARVALCYQILLVVFALCNHPQQTNCGVYVTEEPSTITGSAGDLGV